MYDDMQRYWSELAGIVQTLPLAPLASAADMLLQCYRRGGTVFVAGNGGSAATASHFACDLAKGTRLHGYPAFRVIPLTDNVPLLTAWANDVDYERVFAEQLAALARPGDVLVAISVSGNSPNVLAAVEEAQRRGLFTVALTGQPGGRLASAASLVIRTPSGSIEQVEDVHMAVAHSVCVALRAQLAREAATTAKGGDPFDVMPDMVAIDRAV